jgi:phosphoglycolate phosphatase
VLDVKYRLIIFDMDGTLVDSFPWFLAVMNTVAEKYRLRRVEPEDVEALRGYDSPRILDWLGVPRWKLPVIARDMRAMKKQALHEIALFHGVGELLATLARKGIVLAIVSSDSESNVRTSLGSDNAQLIRHYACGASLFGKAPKFKTILRRSGIPAAQAIAIGDESRDAEAARQAGVAFGAVAWGYANLASLQAHAPAEVFMDLDDIATRLA